METNGKEYNMSDIIGLATILSFMIVIVFVFFIMIVLIDQKKDKNDE